MRKVSILVCFAFLLALPAICQTFGEITGTVKDPSGAAISGATITVTNINTNANRQSISNDAGVYAFPSLPPASYTVKVEKAGFKSVNRTGIVLEVQQSARLDFTLPVGEVSQSIEVSAQAALLSSQNATVGTVIENKRIVDLPLNGRNYLQLVSLAPNVSFGFPSAGQAGLPSGRHSRRSKHRGRRPARQFQPLHSGRRGEHRS